MVETGAAGSVTGGNPGMRGRVCLVTGGTGGIGLETARGLVRQGATVVIAGRDAGRGRAAVEQLQGGPGEVEFLPADLSVQREVRRLAEEVKCRHAQLHVLVNNVGGLFLNGQTSSDGLEMTLALNHLGPYLLTHSLLDLLRASAPARIVNVSSLAHHGARIALPELRFGGWSGYKRSKLANILFTYELARRLEGTGVSANTLSPGLVDSDFGRNNAGPFRWVRPLAFAFALSCPNGARTSIHLASSPDVDGISGRYFTRCKPRRSSRASHDRRTAAGLWEISAELTGVSA
jgi:NAD(P)-dependent dehydrogenase (short-subunit alcohol dehydrogenase family)